MNALVRLALIGLAVAGGLRADAMVEIRSNRASTIRIDGELAGSAPMTLTGLSPGTHTLTAQIGGTSQVKTFFIQSPAGATVQRFIDLDAEVPTPVLSRPAVAAPTVVSYVTPAPSVPTVCVAPSFQRDVVMVPAYEPVAYQPVDYRPTYCPAPPPPPPVCAPAPRHNGAGTAAGILIGVGLIAALASHHDHHPAPAYCPPPPRPPVCAPAPPRPVVCAPPPPRPPVCAPAPTYPQGNWGNGNGGWNRGGNTGHPGNGGGNGYGNGHGNNGNAWGRKPNEGPDRGRGRPITGRFSALPSGRSGLVDGGLADPQLHVDLIAKIATRKSLGIF